MSGVDAHTHDVAALQAELTAAQTRAYELAVAIMGGEDAPGFADSVETAYLAKMIRKERGERDDAETRTNKAIEHWRHEVGKLHSQIAAYTAELTELRLQCIAADGQAGDHYDARIAAEAERNQLRETTKEIAAILQAAVVSGKVRGGDSYRIGGVYLQTVSDALDAANAALTPNTGTPS
jgi:chromosome segregation ATPase